MVPIEVDGCEVNDVRAAALGWCNDEIELNSFVSEQDARADLPSKGTQSQTLKWWVAVNRLVARWSREFAFGLIHLDHHCAH